MSHFQDEIHAQPEALQGVIANPRIAEVAAKLQNRTIPMIVTVARGSSDHALTFFSYLAGQYLGLPVASLPPSLLTVYGSRMKVSGALAVGVSQSGESSDVVESLHQLKQAGALSLAITNQAGSALETLAEHALYLGAGREQAVAATKTFSGQMMALALLVAHWSQDTALLRALESVPKLLRQLLAEQAPIERAALRLTHAEQVYVLGRGLSFGPALEIALKLKETSYLHAQAYSSAEFQHGPIASVDPKDPIVLIASSDGTLASNLQVAERLHAIGADLTVISGAAALVSEANAPIALPAGLNPASEAFLQVLAGQLLALHLTRSKGLDPDQPRHLRKVTQTM